MLVNINDIAPYIKNKIKNIKPIIKIPPPKSILSAVVDLLIKGKPPEEKPPEEMSCGGCVENWVCGDWTPKECPKSEIQTRNCVDLNSCGTTNEKPETTRTCTYEKSNTFLIVILIILAIAIIATISIILYLTIKKKKQVPPAGQPTGQPYRSTNFPSKPFNFSQ